MNNRSGIVIFFLFLFLSVMVLLQVLSMIQADRLFERVNRLERTVENSGAIGTNFGNAIQNQNYQNRDPNEGDWLVWSLQAEPATLNPITNKDVFGDTIVMGHIFESLIEYDPDTLKFRPLLAKDWEISKDGLEITFNIKDEARFSDGKPVTSDDVIFTFKTITDPNVDAMRLSSSLTYLKETLRVTDKRVKFIFSEPYYKSLEAVGLNPIIPRHVYQYTNARQFNDIRSNPLGSGPYIFEKWDVGRQITLTRNERYWGKRVDIDKLVFKIISNEVAAIQSLRTHETDFVQPTAEQFDALKSEKSFGKEFYQFALWNPAVGFFYVGWNQENPIFADHKVTLALTHAIDREAIINYVYKGLAKIVTGPFYPMSKQADPNIKPWPYDPAKARQILAEDGWKDTNGDGVLDKNGKPLKFRLMVPSGSPLVERIAKLMKDNLAGIGVDVSIDPYEWSVFIQRLDGHQFDAMMAGWGGGVESDPYQIWHSSQIANKGSNHISYRNPEVDKLLEEARRTMDETKRNELYHKFAWILHEEQPYTFLFARPEFRLLDRRFHNVIEHKLGLDNREWFVPKNEQRYK